MNFQIRLKSSSVFDKGGHYIDRHGTRVIRDVPVLVCQTKVGGKAHKSKKIFFEGPLSGNEPV